MLMGKRVMEIKTQTLKLGMGRRAREEQGANQSEGAGWKEKKQV